MEPSPILFFDGVCNLCNGAVRFIIRHDKKGFFRFASLQSEAAQRMLPEYGDLKKFDSVILLENGQLFQKSAAVLKVLNHLPWYWKWTQVFWIIPKSIRDVVYDGIANNRYRWFGKRDTCMIPTLELAARFLD
jgi:predicted DCC family thiol-disulfide oxidoreductase YuxK